MLYKKDLSRNTVEAYASDMELFIKFLSQYRNESYKDVDTTDISKNDVRAWFLSRLNDDISSKSIRRGLSAIKCYISYLQQENVYNEQHASIMSMKPPKIQRSIPRPVNAEDIAIIIKSIDYFRKADWIKKRDKAILILIYSVGLRISEALDVKLSDIKEETLLIHGKGGKTRYVPLLSCVRDVIQEYINSAPNFKNNDDALFVNIRGEKLKPGSIEDLVKHVREFAMLGDKVTPHALRHSCATHLIEQGADLRHVQELLGHNSVSSTQIYADIANSHMNKVYKQCHPLSLKNFDHTKL